MLICTICPEGENEIPVGMEFDHIRLMHSDVLEAVAEKVQSGTAGLASGTPADVAHHMIHIMEQRSAFLEGELAGMTSMAETKQAFHEKQAHRYRAMISFCDWIVQYCDSGEELDRTAIRARAKKVRHAWPTTDEQKGAQA